jgi:hypothetical protein
LPEEWLHQYSREEGLLSEVVYGPSLISLQQAMVSWPQHLEAVYERLSLEGAFESSKAWLKYRSFQCLRMLRRQICYGWDWMAPEMPYELAMPSDQAMAVDQEKVLGREKNFLWK